MTNFIFPEQRQKERYFIITGSAQEDKQNNLKIKTLAEYLELKPHILGIFSLNTMLTHLLTLISGRDWLKTQKNISVINDN